jgi:hypothetical protein
LFVIDNGMKKGGGIMSSLALSLAVQAIQSTGTPKRGDFRSGTLSKIAGIGLLTATAAGTESYCRSKNNLHSSLFWGLGGLFAMTLVVLQKTRLTEHSSLVEDCHTKIEDVETKLQDDAIALVEVAATQEYIKELYQQEEHFNEFLRNKNLKVDELWEHFQKLTEVQCKNRKELEQLICVLQSLEQKHAVQLEKERKLSVLQKQQIDSLERLTDELKDLLNAKASDTFRMEESATLTPSDPSLHVDDTAETFPEDIQRALPIISNALRRRRVTFGH